MNFKGDVNGTALDSSYIPDELDQVNADVAACGVIYSFYGRLSVAELDVDTLRAGNLPPTYVCYGTNEVFRSQIERHITALREAGVTVGVNMLEGYSHGFGANGNWCPDFDAFLMQVFPEEITLNVEPVVRENEISYTIETESDVSNMDILTALYTREGVLISVKTNAQQGRFETKPGESYTLKVFAWKKNTMNPLRDAYTFSDLRFTPEAL